MAETLDEMLRRMGVTPFNNAPLSQPPVNPSSIPEGFNPTPGSNPRGILADRAFERQRGDTPTGIGDVVLDRAINPLLTKLGLSGVARGLNKVADFAGDISGASVGAAERGTLGALAPQFQAGVSQAADRRLREAFQNAQIQLGQDRNAIAQGRNEILSNSPANNNVQSTFRGQNGNMWIVTRDGKTVDTGVEFSTNVRLFEQPDGSVQAVDSTTGQVIGTPVTPDQAAESTRRQAVNQSTSARQAEAVVELPRLREQVGETVDLLKKLKDHPGKSGAIGLKGASQLFGLRDRPASGTKEADFVALLEQVQGGVFLDAYQQLKGGGQITEGEGRKAEQARTRLVNRDQSEVSFDESLDDYLGVIQKGLDRLENEAQGNFVSQSEADALLEKYK